MDACTRCPSEKSTLEVGATSPEQCRCEATNSWLEAVLCCLVVEEFVQNFLITSYRTAGRLGFLLMVQGFALPVRLDSIVRALVKPSAVHRTQRRWRRVDGLQQTAFACRAIGRAQQAVRRANPALTSPPLGMMQLAHWSVRPIP